MSGRPLPPPKGKRGDAIPDLFGSEPWPPRRGGDAPVTVEAEIVRCTDLAVLVRTLGGDEVGWLPFSEIEPDAIEIMAAEAGAVVEFTMPEWLAIEKGLV